MAEAYINEHRQARLFAEDFLAANPRTDRVSISHGGVRVTLDRSGNEHVDRVCTGHPRQLRRQRARRGWLSEVARRALLPGEGGSVKTIGHFNELRLETERQLAEDANRADAIVGGICLVLFLGYAVASYLGVIA